MATLGTPPAAGTGAPTLADTGRARPGERRGGPPVERLEGTAAAEETAVGHVPTPDSLDISGLDMTREQVVKALAVDKDEWRAEIPQITEWFEKFGDKLPSTMWDELAILEHRLA